MTSLVKCQTHVYLPLDWGTEAFKIDDYYFWVPTTMPIVGAVLGAIIYEFVVGIHVPGAGGRPIEDNDEDSEFGDFEPEAKKSDMS